jgi:hypothetical protein
MSSSWHERCTGTNNGYLILLTAAINTGSWMNWFCLELNKPVDARAVHGRFLFDRKTL